MKPNVRVDRVVGHGQVEAVPLGDGRPVGHGGPAQRIDADAQSGGGDDRHVDDGGQVST